MRKNFPSIDPAVASGTTTFTTVTMHHADSPFSLDNTAAYAAWREQKLAGYPATVDDLIVEVNDPRRLSSAEFNAMNRCCRKTNMAIYAGATGNNPDKQIAALLGRQFGLTAPDCNTGADDDGITTLRVVEDEWRGEYIPYTNRPIHWHTDGYYNEQSRQIRALQLHCVSPATQGGENALLDHEIAYIHLRDENPDYIHALMQADVMTIPANVKNGQQTRPARTGPVFSVQTDGSLHMRYTARTRSIAWKNDPAVLGALDTLSAFLESDSRYIFRATLQSGQGLVCNNILHDRTGFTDTAACTRKLYRLRYYRKLDLAMIK
jgi:alpha-ketoglutarate-dependent taurine dioxygenase